MGFFEAGDYFELTGYRKMILTVLKQTAGDLLLKPGTEKNDALIAAAQEWVLFSPSESTAAGLTFEDCIVALGEGSFSDQYRRGFLEHPQEAFRAANLALEGMAASEGFFSEVREQRKDEPLSTGQFDASWLFGGSQARRDQASVGA